MCLREIPESASSVFDSAKGGKQPLSFSSRAPRFAANLTEAMREAVGDAGLNEIQK